jgi:beta-ribofuranosylaminobenzene 5'-phosphate synthase
VTLHRLNDDVFVEAPGRLHLGVLDLGGSLGRWFGGLGTAAPVPPLLVSASHTESGIECEGDDAERACGFASTYLQHHGITSGVRLRVHRALPRHSGLGSGTQLGLAVARALAELHAHDTEVTTLAQVVGRTRRSGVGMWVFAGGGLVVEGGRGPETRFAPLLTRLPFPASWRVIVAIPDGLAGISGPLEEMAFDRLPTPPSSDAERVAHRVLMAMLPALVEGDLATFGAALTEIQRITGHWFGSVQGGTFTPASQPVIDLFRGHGLRAVGQSSWGPAVYGVVDGDVPAEMLASEARRVLGPDGSVFTGPFRTEGARVWRVPTLVP